MSRVTPNIVIQTVKDVVRSFYGLLLASLSDGKGSPRQTRLLVHTVYTIKLLTLYRAGGSTRVAKVLAFATFGLQILKSVNYVC